ncbi:TetR/AcrR family transcriptional regulator [Nocardia aurantiaca]|uniref:TetR family transcriptional regulator n=1 Tax=Nocardia aurantiaca TaxID=2675850 RepID=A0A6I3L4I2_9NOCA|nr:TetR/AcrR family transcriptional regulator [Nocardia aurantiaca]MTE16757.1 TetR family transcriptional regulator [Nocardia aurantiaca]
MAATRPRLRPDSPLRGPGRPKAADGLDTREVLLRVGLRLFATKGFAGVSVNEIAEAAKVSAPVIYQRFGSKAGLFVAVAEDVYARGLGHLESSMAGVERFDEAIDLVLQGFAELYRMDRELTAMVLTVLVEVSRDDVLADELQPTLRTFRAFFDGIAALAPPTIASDARSRRDLSRALVAMCSGLTSAAVMTTNAADYESMVEIMRTIITVRTREVTGVQDLSATENCQAAQYE